MVLFSIYEWLNMLVALHKGLACLARFADEVDIVATRKTFTISAINTSKSAYGKLEFSHRLFQDYSALMDFEIIDGTVHSNYNNPVHFRINAKLLLSYLKHRNDRHQAIQNVRLELRVPHDHSKSSQQCEPEDSDSDEESLESHLVITVTREYDVQKIHRLKLLETEERLEPRVDATAKSHRIVMGYRVLAIIMERERIVLTNSNLITELPVDHGLIATEVQIAAMNFIDYELTEENTSLSLHVREFSAVAEFAKQMDKNMKISVTKAGQPLVMEVWSETQERDPYWRLEAWIATAEREEYSTITRKRPRPATEGAGSDTNRMEQEQPKRQRLYPAEAPQHVVERTVDEGNAAYPSPHEPAPSSRVEINVSPEQLDLTSPTGNEQDLSSPTKHGTSPLRGSYNPILSIKRTRPKNFYPNSPFVATRKFY
ncbi:hypothetical protein CALCODRAFT_507540 [Calocera cornea HHB12733]|uniref:Uncharacterized protein n=1 Tax=Calocera cornea HHB12733 TaxID=1353952 RepID=A0A165HHX8_9BASI|nr:hypothetical protein CALCODRAFT_507540 [Calocera cornea HHB12733]